MTDVTFWRRSSRDLIEMALVVATTVVGAGVRASSWVAESFPLNDGGLFYQMILDLQDTWPYLPPTTSYNEMEIPFAYPPLAFYLGAFLHDFMGGMEVLRIVPLLLSCLTVPALYLLARAMTGGILVPTMAAMAFALMPRSFEWLLMGGGLTRSLGLLVGIAALWLTWRLFDRPTLAGALLAGITGGLTALAHPQSALFALTAGLIFSVARVRSRRAFLAVAQAAAVAGLVTAPWLVGVLLHHGPGPIFSASGTQPGLMSGVFNLIGLDFSGSRISDILGFLAVAGIILSILNGQWLLPLWFAAVLLLDSRGGAIYATVPASLLAGQAIAAFVIAPVWRPPLTARVPSRYVRQHPISAIMLLLFFAIALTDAVGSQVAPDWPGVALTAEQREGMSWVEKNAPEDAEYLVVSGRTWAVDATAEWFPVLAEARSVATVQGTEWLGSDVFEAALQASDELRKCANQTPKCIQAWSAKWGVDYSHVYLPKGSVSGPLGEEDCCIALRETLRTDPKYEVIYDRFGATIFERIGPQSLQAGSQRGTPEATPTASEATARPTALP